eukprot:COSAG01_NODE_20513_length_949_cov_2.655294_1_plen_48_part_10
MHPIIGQPWAVHGGHMGRVRSHALQCRQPPRRSSALVGGQWTVGRSVS